MISKVLICPYFGPFPEWFDYFLADFNRTMKPQGYTLLLEVDLPDFKRRVKEKLGIDYTGQRGSGKVWDMRCALGLLYEEEIKGYDYFGHVDFDVVFGDVNGFIPDSELQKIDVWSGHNEYVCGCISLYRNSSQVRNLFKQCEGWQNKMTSPEPNGWVEAEYSTTLLKSGLKFQYTFYQGNPWDREPILKKEGNKLFQLIDGKWIQIAFFHFRHSKRWPL